MSTLKCGALILLASLVAVSSLRAEPSAPYVAFSLSTASRLEARPDTLAAITHVTGMVYDSLHDDIIVVGRAGDGEPISIADLVVALRARIQFAQYPLVSIDRTPATDTTGKQKIRFEGGLAHTGFGSQLLSADLRLKMLALGLADPESSYFEMFAGDLRRGVNLARGSALLWFYPAGGELVERDNVFAIRSLTIGLKTQTIAGPPDVVADRFAQQTSARFDEMADQYPEIGRLRTLYSLVALATAMEKHPDEAGRIMARFPIPTQVTPAEYKLVTRSERIGQRELAISGGIRLAVRRLRLREGDVSALRDAVLESRPSLDTVSWVPPIDDWLLPDGAVDDVTLPVDEDDPGTHIVRRVEIVPDLLIYRGGIRGNQVLTDPRLGASGASAGDGRGGVAAGVEVHDEDVVRRSRAKSNSAQDDKTPDSKKESPR